MCGTLCKESDSLLASRHIKNVLTILCFWEENTRIVMNRRGLALVTHDCEPTLRYDWFSGSVEWKWRRMASRSGFLSWQMVVFCVGCCYCRTVCLCLSRYLQNPFAMMPCGIQGHPISNRNEVCLGFFCLCCTANSVGVICFISSFVFVGIFFFFWPLHLAILRFTYLLSEPCQTVMRHSFWIRLQQHPSTWCNQTTFLHWQM